MMNESVAPSVLVSDGEAVERERGDARGVP